MKRLIRVCLALLFLISAFTYRADAQNVTITLTPINPPIQIPAAGGSFNYDATLINANPTPVTCQVWAMIRYPDSTWYGPVFSPENLTLQGNSLVSRERTQTVPAIMPAGHYMAKACVGNYPNSLWDSDEFGFDKEGTPGGTQLWVARSDSLCCSLENGSTSSMAVDSSGNVYVAGAYIAGK
jgi:hypothetical protein